MPIQNGNITITGNNQTNKITKFIIKITCRKVCSHNLQNLPQINAGHDLLFILLPGIYRFQV